MASEKRLIDADALRETVITDYYEHYTQCHDTDQIALIDMVCDGIDEAHTVDAVEVVRCKDCKHFDGIWFCKICGVPSRKPDDFCSYGKRREE